MALGVDEILEEANYYIVVGEGASEVHYLDLLIDGNCLKISREQIINEKVIKRPNKSKKDYYDNQLRYDYGGKVGIILVCDREDGIKTHISRIHLPKIAWIAQFLTRPELEIIMIHYLGMYEQYMGERRKQNQNLSPTEFLTRSLKVSESQLKGKPFIENTFTDLSKLCSSVKKCHSTKCDKNKKLFELRDLLK